MKQKYYSSIFLLLIISIIPFSSTAQKKKPARIKAEYVKEANQIETIIISLVVKDERYEPFSGAEVHVYHFNDTSKILVGTVQTNKSGLAKFLVQESPKLYFDDENKLAFEVAYEGTDEIRSASRKLSFNLSTVKLSFNKEDGIGYLEAELVELNSNESLKPVEGVSIKFYVQGTFSQLIIGEEKTEDDGKATIEFPSDLPGDRLGNLEIIVKVVEDRSYGTVEASGTIDWGTPLIPAVEKHRGLGDTDAPLWMVYTLIILLSAVWFHYLYVIYMIFRIKVSR